MIKADLYRTINRVLADPHRLIDVLASSPDEEEGIRRLCAAYGVSAEEAVVLLDLQFRQVLPSMARVRDDFMKGLSS
jgi:hypothetical protein